MLEAQSSIRKINEARQADGEQEMVSKEDDECLQLLKEKESSSRKRRKLERELRKKQKEEQKTQG